MVLFNPLWHYVGGPPSRRSLCLFWRETEQRAWTRDLRRDRKWEGKGRSGEAKGAVGKGTQRRSVGEERRREAVENGSGKDQSRWVSSLQKEAVKEDSQTLVGIPCGFCRSFAKNTLPVIVFKMHEKLYKKVSQNYPSCTWSWPKSILFACSFSPTPSVVFLVTVRKCVIPLSEPTGWITGQE